ncbi:hypothetical protein U91I_01562 [alpha proteobacterium U9-1i]|nr:hypothetical protein U91I_01562 [alpha proteobacterium U9-1i]
MKLTTSEALAAYMVDDWISVLSARAGAETGQMIPQCQQWLDDAPAKRMLFSDLYGDILRGCGPKRVLDVGGGLTHLTASLAAHGTYCLVDPLHHDGAALQRAIITAAPPFEIIRGDWSASGVGEGWDVIIANDLFPNVDQRLAAFLAWAVPRAREVRLSLTFYNNGRSYEVQRVDAEEKLTVLAFDGEATRRALVPYASRIAGWSPEVFDASQGSLFANGRHVATLSVKGDF